VEPHSEWAEKAFDALLSIIKKLRSGTEVTCESLRVMAEYKGITAPRDKRSWGPVMMRAGREGYLIKTDRVTPAVDPRVHANPIAIGRRS
jgi:hypothetical protein